MTQRIFVILLFIGSSLFGGPNWTVDVNQYQYSMTVTGVLSINNVESGDTNDIVGAFVNGQCVGVAKPIYVTDANRYEVFLLVYSNNIQGDTIEFKLYDASEKKEYMALYKTSFMANQTLGTPLAPVSINTHVVNSVSEITSTIGLFPNPVRNVLNITGITNNTSNIIIKDVNGKVVVNQAFGKTISVRSLKSGMYFVVMNNKRTVFVKE